MDSVALRKHASRFDREADALPALDDRAEKLRDLARKARNRASLKEHSEPDDQAVVKQSPVLGGASRVRRGRIGATAA